jgi:histidinol-phosphate aminotransferase
MLNRSALGVVVLKPRAAVLNVKAYHPPLGDRTGLRLDFNENTVGCSLRVLQRLKTISAEDLARYPERTPIEALVAEHLNVRPEELLLTNGTDEAIHLLCETYLDAGTEALIVVPTYSMYEIYAAATGAKVIAIPAGEDFFFPVDELLSKINENTRLIAIANPNNPTGVLVPSGDVFRIAQAAPQAAILIDEAYFEFCGKTVLPAFRQFPNIFVSRTFSKVYGLAGLRVGVLAGNVEQMPLVRRVGSPYSVNAVALACLPEALADQTYIRQYVDEVLVGRKLLEEELRSLGIKYWPSHANFVLLRIGDRAQAFISAMRSRGILVRDRSNDPGCAGCLRITLGSTSDNARLLGSLREIVVELGLREKVKA